MKKSMKKYLLYATIIGCLGIFPMYFDVFVPLNDIFPFLVIFAVALSTTLIAFKLSVGLSPRVVTIHVLQATVLSTVITNLSILAGAGYLWLLRTQQPGHVGIRTVHTNFYRDAPEVALNVFLFMILIGFALSVTLSFVARYFTRRRFVSRLSEKTD